RRILGGGAQPECPAQVHDTRPRLQHRRRQLHRDFRGRGQENHGNTLLPHHFRRTRNPPGATPIPWSRLRPRIDAVIHQDRLDPVAVFTEHPRLLLRPQRLRLLKRERERTSPRWQLFETLVLGNAPLPEPGFAYALYYQVAGNADVGHKAVEYALGSSSDLRQQAFVFDWCQNLLSENQSRALGTRLQQGLAPSPA